MDWAWKYNMTILETIILLQEHKINCDRYTVEKWIEEGKLMATVINDEYEINLSEVVDFLYNLSLVGTADEKGIDDKTKIERLRTLVERLEVENDKLRWEKTLLEFELGISPFN